MLGMWGETVKRYHATSANLVLLYANSAAIVFAFSHE